MRHVEHIGQMCDTCHLRWTACKQCFKVNCQPGSCMAHRFLYDSAPSSSLLMHKTAQPAKHRCLMAQQPSGDVTEANGFAEPDDNTCRQWPSVRSHDPALCPVELTGKLGLVHGSTIRMKQVWEHPSIDHSLDHEQLSRMCLIQSHGRSKINKTD